MVGFASCKKFCGARPRLDLYFAWHNLTIAGSGIWPGDLRMYFEQFYLTCLAHASYMIGSEGEAAVVDPHRDVDIYLKAAEEQNFKIRHIFETHLHADFVSGHKELAARTGAKIYIGAQARAEFAHVPLTDGF